MNNAELARTLDEAGVWPAWAPPADSPDAPSARHTHVAVNPAAAVTKEVFERYAMVTLEHHLKRSMPTDDASITSGAVVRLRTSPQLQVPTWQLVGEGLAEDVRAAAAGHDPIREALEKRGFKAATYESVESAREDPRPMTDSEIERRAAAVGARLAREPEAEPVGPTLFSMAADAIIDAERIAGRAVADTPKKDRDSLALELLRDHDLARTTLLAVREMRGDAPEAARAALKAAENSLTIITDDLRGNKSYGILRHITALNAMRELRRNPLAGGDGTIGQRDLAAMRWSLAKVESELQLNCTKESTVRDFKLAMQGAARDMARSREGRADAGTTSARTSQPLPVNAVLRLQTTLFSRAADALAQASVVIRPKLDALLASGTGLEQALERVGRDNLAANFAAKPGFAKEVLSKMQEMEAAGNGWATQDGHDGTPAQALARMLDRMGDQEWLSDPEGSPITEELRRECQRNPRAAALAAANISRQAEPPRPQPQHAPVDEGAPRLGKGEARDPRTNMGGADILAQIVGSITQKPAMQATAEAARASEAKSREAGLDDAVEAPAQAHEDGSVG